MTQWYRRLLQRRALPAPVDLVNPINSALVDAEVLIAFAAQSRRSPKAELLTRLTRAIQAIDAAKQSGQSLTPEHRTSFWTAYDEIAVAMAPLSAHSIRSSLQINQRRFPGSLMTPPAALAAVAILVFGICIVTQSFWVAGKDLLDRADAIETQRVEVERRRLDGETLRLSTESKVKRLTLKQCDLEGGCVDPTKPNATPEAKRDLNTTQREELARLKIQQDTLVVEVEDRRLANDRLRAEIQELNARGEPIAELLKAWHGKVRSVCQFASLTRFLCVSEETAIRTPNDGAGSTKNITGESAPAVAAVEPSQVIKVPAETARTLAIWFREMQSRISHQDELAKSARKQRENAHEVRIILGNLGTYVIPLFMGMLGSLAFMLQTIATQLKDHTYVPISASASIVRICLGAVAGVFGGLATPGAETVLKTLPPLFVPFVFGYGIEILFSLLNRIVRTFTQPDSTGAKNG